MKKTKYILSIFILLAIVQICVPTSMIIKKKKVLNNGEVIKYKLAPLDPVSPFKGKYLRLSFEENGFSTTIDSIWKRGRIVYLYYKLDTLGFATIDKVSSTALPGSLSFIKARVSYYDNFSRKLFVKYPFDEYYIEESKSLKAEKLIAEYLNKKKGVVYAEIAVLNGDAALKNIIVGNETILEFVSRQ